MQYNVEMILSGVYTAAMETAANSLMTADQVAKMLKVGTRTVQRMARDKKIPCVRIGAKIIRFDRVAITKWLANKQK